MRRLIVAGLIYLTGIAVILVIKPQYMFREDGRWKEFGIGRDPENFTHVPFWLFAIIWAIISYVTVTLIENAVYNSEPIEYEQPQRNTRNYRKNTGSIRGNVNANGDTRDNGNSGPRELTPGYYMLNEGATGRNGVPRYVYLGPEDPEL